MLEEKELTERIIRAAINVHRALGPGFIESVYETALAIEFDVTGVQYERQKAVAVLYRGQAVGEHRLDYLVERAVVVELKAIQALEDIHFAIVRSYLKATGLHTALLLNFATMPLTIKRVGREESGRHARASEFLIS
ncbi:MAG: GxxExxY protein [Pedosphaera parvula]|nr:GxxExxY protein [Pedosphaera parvula]